MRVVFAAMVAAMVAIHEPVTVEDLDSAIRWLTRSAPGSNPMQTDPVGRREMAEAAHAAALDTDIDPYLLVVMAARESSFKAGASGTLGELGVVQIHGAPLRQCKTDGLDMTRPSGQLMCGARYLRQLYDHCGSLIGGLSAYASGSCTPRTDKTAWIVTSRLRAARRLRGRPWEEQ